MDISMKKKKVLLVACKNQLNLVRVFSNHHLSEAASLMTLQNQLSQNKYTQFRATLIAAHL